MTSELKVDKITPASGTNTQIGEAGDTTNLSAGTVTLPTSIITGASEKTTLVDADKFLIADSADSNAFKHVQKSNMPSGAMTLLNSTTSTGLSAVNYDNFSATYDVYKLIGSCSTGTNNAEVRLQVRKSSSNITASNYRYAYVSAERTSSASTSSSKGGWNAGSIQLTNGSSYSAAHPTAFEVTIYAPFDSTRNTSMTVQSAYYRPNEDTWYSWAGGVWVDGSSGNDNTGISLFASSGTIDNAKMALYGVQKS